MSMCNVKGVLLLAMAGVLVAGCSVRPIGGETGWKIVGPPGPAGPSGVAGIAGPAGPAGPAGAPGADARWLPVRNVYFDLDKHDVRPGERGKIDEVAAFMKQNPTFLVGIDGHADPRGGRRHNQALSERRVNQVREALIAAGVPASRIGSVGAFGAQRRACDAATEDCWQQDRRVDVYIQ